MGQLWDVPTGWGAVRPDSQRGYGHLVLKAKGTQRALLTQTVMKSIHISCGLFCSRGHGEWGGGETE